MTRAAPLLAALGLAGCFLPGFDRDESAATTSTVTSTGVGGGGGAGGAALGFCESASFPPAPPIGVGGAGGAPSLDLAFALRSIDLGETNPSTRPGFDLDRVCTCCTDCKTPPDACTPPAFALPDAACDAEADGAGANLGRDNALAKVLASFGTFGSALPVGSSTMNGRIADGQWTLLIRVSDYNGLPDDDQVTVSLFTTAGIAPSKPVWDGNDVWPIRSDSLAPNFVVFPDPRDAATVLNGDAYVSGGRLVGVFDGAPGSKNRLSLNLNGGFVLTLSTAIFSADLTETTTGWSLKSGTMGGIWNLEDVFKALSAIRPMLCTDNIIYGSFKKQLCGFVDIRSGAPSPQPCDALSFGLSFTADPIVMGSVSLAGLAAPGCPMATDPLYDTCD